MELWTYKKAKQKILSDLDMQDESFVSPNELVGYFNEGLLEAETEISELNAEYMLTKYYLPLQQGVSRYDLPYNILANKIRNIIYANGSTVYPIERYRRRNKFENIILTDNFGSADWYMYYLVNDVPGQAQLELSPTSRDTAIYPPQANAFTPATMWYIRNCARIPIVDDGNFDAEYCNPEIVAPSAIDLGNRTIQTLSGTRTFGAPQLGRGGCYPGSIPYVTGDKVKLKAGPFGALPSPLVEDTVYYVIAMGSGLIKLATTLANAQAGTAIVMTDIGSVSMEIRVCATAAIVDATILDIPEFSPFVIQWAKVRCLQKDGGDPRLMGEVETLVDLKKQMVETLTNAIPDDNDEIERDLSHYMEMS